MHRLMALFQKDLTQLLRDRSGLLVLFLMPVILIIVISLVHNAAPQSATAPKIHALILDYDQHFPLATFTNRLKQVDYLSITYQHAQPPVDLHYAQQQVDSEVYKACLVIPPGTTESMQNLLDPERQLAEEEFPALQMLSDPLIPTTTRKAIQHSISYILLSIEMSSLLKAQMQAVGNDTTLPDRLIPINEVSSTDPQNTVLPTATQQNVPAWTLFAMFFIVIPFSAQLINERQSGILQRITAASTSYATILTAKIILFSFICILQFLLMLAAGFYVLPLLGVPQLNIGTSHYALIVVVITSALAANGFGALVGTIARTHQQASVFGAVSIVIAAALGGIMVPVFFMPETMQIISRFSPLAWGLDAFLEVFLRNGDLHAIQNDVFRLSAFFVATILVALIYRCFEQRKQQ